MFVSFISIQFHNVVDRVYSQCLPFRLLAIVLYGNHVARKMILIEFRQITTIQFVKLKSLRASLSSFLTFMAAIKDCICAVFNSYGIPIFPL
jgi:hypothetical protein